jgi:UDP-N-acetyl-D-glucosamine dehydrogenase
VTSASTPPADPELSFHALALERAIQSRTATIGVIGLGYVGLPIVRVFVSAGFRVLGFDTDPAKVASLQRGESYIAHIGSDWLAEARRLDRFTPTCDPRRLAEPEVLLICVPTPLAESHEPDLQFVTATADAIAAVLRPGQLVVLESTTYPGTTRELLLPRFEAGGLRVGRDVFLAYSPEREDPGNRAFETGSIPKVVGGLDPASLHLADLVYRQVVVTTVRVSTPEIAEASKLLENVYRAVNIALVNELKMVFDRLGIDIWEVIAAASTKPFGFQPFYPGPGWGGHCIPVDPFYLSWLAERSGSSAQFIELAGQINRSMPGYVLDRLEAALIEDGGRLAGSSIGVLGVAYKPNVDDPRESPAFPLIEGLLARGATVSYSDPHIPRLPAMRSFDVPSLTSQPLTPDWLASLDAAIICTHHAAFDYQHIVDHCRLVVDTRNATAGLSGVARVVQA